MNATDHPGPSQTTQPASGLTGPIGLLIVAATMIGLLAILVAMDISPSPLTWYLARASGFTLYLLFWLSVVSGLALSTRLLDTFGGRDTWWRIHTLAADLAFSFLGLHMVTLAVDPTEPLGLLGTVFPFASDVRQPWTDIGIITAWGMVLVITSFSLRRFIGMTGWRLLHYGSFPLWLLALIHGLGSGSDTTRLWALLLYSVTTGVVLFLFLFRLLTTADQRPGNTALDRPPVDALDEFHRERGD